jgi:hypothetical protein
MSEHRPTVQGAAAAQQAMSISYFHWALHPWAVYAIVGLALAYFTFRKGMPNLISSAFDPPLGDRVKGPIGRSIDILAIFATLFGSATSLGLGALQINSGLDFLWGVEPSDAIAVTIIAVLTAAFVLSAVSGVHRGIQWLSNGNMILAILLVLFLLIVGPTVFQFETLVESIGGHLTMIVPASFRTGAFGDSECLSAWTIFNWAWWISWAPFVGTFIARISKGRAVREFVIGVLGIPSGVSFVWFAVFGGAAIDLPARRHRPRRDRRHARDRALQRRGRRVAGDGHALLAREPVAAAPRDHPLGRRDRRVGRDPAAGRWPQLAPAGRDHRRRAVHGGDGRALCIGVQGARRGGGAADHPRVRPRARRAHAGAGELGAVMPDNSQRRFRGVFDMFSELNRTREHWTEIEPSQGRSQPAVWVPAVDIFADGEDLVIRCELAGVAKEDIDVSLSDGRLWISGERIEVTGAENEQARLDVTG